MSHIHSGHTDNPSEDLFGEVISSYTDREAVEDGFLAAIAGPGGVNRVTRAVFDHFTEVMGAGVTNITPLRDAIRHMLTLEIDDGWRTGNYQGKALWLIPNEVGGFTSCFRRTTSSAKTTKEQEKKLPLSFFLLG
jgi:hypothetical protein